MSSSDYHLINLILSLLMLIKSNESEPNNGKEMPHMKNVYPSSGSFQWKPHSIPSTSTLTLDSNVNSIPPLHQPFSSTFTSSSSSHYKPSFPSTLNYNNNQSPVTSASRFKGKRASTSSSSTSTSDSYPDHLIRDSCSDDSECLNSKTKCIIRQGLCGCSPGYIIVDLITPSYTDIPNSPSSGSPSSSSSASSSSSYSSSPSLGSSSSSSSSSESLSQYVSKFCYKLKRNNEPCEYSVQCFVSHATCERFVKTATPNNQSGVCRCKQGFNEQAGNEVTDFNGFEMKSERICVPVLTIVNKTYLKVTVALSVLTVAALIACALIVVKIKRNKRRAQTETSVATGLNGPSGYGPGGQPGQPYLRDLGNPPPMGSAEAEFQNDFIQVFPMHHLEPCPEKNMTALIMQ